MKIILIQLLRLVIIYQCQCLRSQKGGGRVTVLMSRFRSSKMSSTTKTMFQLTRPDHMAAMDHLVTVGHQATVDHLTAMDHLDMMGRLATVDHLDMMGHLATVVHLLTLDHLMTMDSLITMDLLVPMGHLDMVRQMITTEQMAISIPHQPMTMYILPVHTHRLHHPQTVQTLNTYHNMRNASKF